MPPTHRAPKTTASDPGIFLADIPAELVLMIFEYLPSLWKIHLALTSKRMFQLFCGAFSELALRQLDTEDKLRLLHNLEKDDPRLLYCPGCHRLRSIQYDDASHSSQIWDDTVKHIQCSGQFHGIRVSWDHFWTWWPLPVYRKEKILENVGCSTWELRYSGAVISFFEAHAVIHRQLYGKPHGLPIEGLRKSFSFERWLPANDYLWHDCNHWPLEQHSPQKQHFTRAQQRKLREESRRVSPCSASDLKSISESSLQVLDTGTKEKSSYLHPGKAVKTLHSSPHFLPSLARQSIAS